MVIASLLTLFDLDRIFHVPAANPQKIRLYGWMGGFILVNAALAAGTFFAIRNLQPFRDWQPGFVALAAGTGYLAIIHTKITTFSWEASEVPFGFELLYQGGKNYAFKRINRIAKKARSEETFALAEKEDLAALALRAKVNIIQDALLSMEEKERHKKWLVDVLNDTNDDKEKRLYVANYILSERTEALTPASAQRSS
jgi:hypothetical protein